MAHVELSRSEEWELENESQDIRGWEVVDRSGQRVGTIRELIVDTDRERVTSLVLDSGEHVAASRVRLDDRLVRFDGDASNRETANSASVASTETGGVRQEVDGVPRLPIIEEELRIGKRVVERGGVRVGTHVEATPVEEEVRLREEKVTVERHPTDRPVSERDIEALDGRTIEVTERAEEAVIDKQARVVEEVVVRKDVEERSETIRDTVRRSDVDVQHLGPREGNRGPVEPPRGPIDGPGERAGL